MKPKLTTSGHVAPKPESYGMRTLVPRDYPDDYKAYAFEHAKANLGNILLDLLDKSTSVCVVEYSMEIERQDYHNDVIVQRLDVYPTTTKNVTVASMSEIDFISSEAKNPLARWLCKLARKIERSGA